MKSIQLCLGAVSRTRLSVQLAEVRLARDGDQSGGWLVKGEKWEPSGARQREALAEGNVFSFHWAVLRKRLAGSVTGGEAGGCHKGARAPVTSGESRGLARRPIGKRVARGKPKEPEYQLVAAATRLENSADSGQ